MSLKLEHICRTVEGQTWIDDANLSFEPGSFNVLLGRTLSGKTSLMRLMAGLDKPDSGRILMNGVDVTKRPVRLRNVSMVYQQFINYPTMTVFENIASPLRQGRCVQRGDPEQGAGNRQDAAHRGNSCSVTRWNCPAASSSARPWPGPWSRTPN